MNLNNAIERVFSPKKLNDITHESSLFFFSQFSTSISLHIGRAFSGVIEAGNPRVLRHLQKAGRVIL